MGCFINKKYLKGRSLLYLVFFILIFIVTIGPVLDSDLGWHLATGRFIWLTNSIPRKDLFSFSMPDYPYVYHSWLTEVIIFVVHSHFGMWGVTLFYSVVIALGFWFLVKTSQLKLDNPLWSLSILFFIQYGLVVINYRTQVFTFLGLTILCYFFTKLKPGDLEFPQSLISLNKKFSWISFLQWLRKTKLWLIPLLFLFWVNLHGGFFVGLLMLSLLMGLKIFQIKVNFPSFLYLKQLMLYFTFILFLSVLASLINPYGVKVFLQVIAMGTNSTILRYSYDWAPMFASFPIADFLWYSLLTTMLVVVTCIFAVGDKSTKILLILFFVLSLTSRRYLLPLFVVLMPHIILLLELLLTTLFQKRASLQQLPLYVAIGIVFILLMERTVINWTKTKCAYASEECYAAISYPRNYPFQAVTFMENKGIPNRILNDANWGGYLIWNFPEHKFFIDGRMDNFFIDGRSFLEDYIILMKAQSGWEVLMEKYKIDAILAPPSWPLVQVLRDKSEWEVIFEDEVSVLMILRGSS